MKPCLAPRSHAWIFPIFRHFFAGRFLYLLLSCLLFAVIPLFATKSKPQYESTGFNVAQSNPPYIIERFRANLLLVADNNTTILADGVLTEFNNIYHDSVRLEDARKMTNIKENIALLRHGTLLAIEKRPVITEADTLYFKLWKTKIRKYQLEFLASNLSRPGLVGFLEDAYLKTSTPVDLSGVTRVAFSINTDAASADTGRFRVVFKNTFGARPLPVNFLSLTGYGVKDQLFVEWKVASEINISKYEVERATDGTHFKRISSTQAISSTNASNSYLFKDAAPEEGNNFYRIQSVDLDGTLKYSGIVKISNNQRGAASVAIYPNPASGSQVNLQLSNQPTGNCQVRLISNAGQVAYKGTFKVSHPNFTQTVVPGQTLAAGLYQLEVTTADSRRFVEALLVR